MHARFTPGWRFLSRSPSSSAPLPSGLLGSILTESAEDMWPPWGMISAATMLALFLLGLGPPLRPVKVRTDVGLVGLADVPLPAMAPGVMLMTGASMQSAGNMSTRPRPRSSSEMGRDAEEGTNELVD